MKLDEKLLWLKIHCGLTVYLTDLEQTHHVTPEEFAALFATISPCKSTSELPRAVAAWRESYAPDALQSTRESPVNNSSQPRSAPHRQRLQTPQRKRI